MNQRIRFYAILLLIAASLAAAVLRAQHPFPLHEAIAQALHQNPEATAAKSNIAEAHAGNSMARSALLPQVSFTEDISRGDDPVYAFGSASCRPILLSIAWARIG